MRDSLSLSRTLLVFAGLLLAGAVAQPAPAQTSAAKVEDDGSNVVLQTFFEGQLLAPGVFNSGPIPATGSGTRMMWWPNEAAFRAGRLTGSQWDASKVGDYSVAFGLDTKANGFAAVAMGDGTTASGDHAMAMGDLTTASGGEATAMGGGTTASGFWATAMGDNTTAATNQSVSIGVCNDKNRGFDDTNPDTGPLFVVGDGTESAGGCDSRSDALVLDQGGHLEVTGSYVLPDGTTLDGSEDLGLSTNSNGASQVDNNDGFVATGTFGSGSIPTTGSGTRMMWYPNKAAFRVGRVGVNKTGTRWDASNVGDHSVAFGVDTKASGGAATAMGVGTTASGSRGAAAMGDGTTASGWAATAMGRETTAETDRSLAIGECNSANSSFDGTLFVVGNGNFSSGSCSRSDALVVDDGGDVSIDGVFNDDLSNHAGHFQATKSGTDTDTTVYPVLISNTSTNSNADGLAIKAGPTSNPGFNNNYITFFDGDGDAIGNVEGDGSGGVNFESGAADYAEELPVAVGVPTPEPADLVGVRSGDVTLKTDGADRVMIASTAPIMTANTTPSTEADDARRVAVAFVGQVPARVRGSVEVGDLIVPSGKNDGTARAVSPGEYRRSTHGPIAGQAWSAKTSEEIGEVTVAVGLGRSGAVAKRLQGQQSQIDSLRDRVNQIETLQQRVARLEGGASSSFWAGMPGSSLLLGLLLGGLLGAGLLRTHRS